MLYKLENIQQIYAGKSVLDIPYLEIEPGLVYSLTGANGAGKTTLLNLLAFLDVPTTGKLYFTEQQVKYSRRLLLALRRRVVLVEQYPILFTGSVAKNVEFGLKMRGMPPVLRRQRVMEVIKLVGMQKFLYADAHKLSGGETKRVALARALAVQPEVLLCDEPGANVDRENQEIILTILKKLTAAKKTSVIFSTHYLSQGRQLADMSLMLEHGRLAALSSENIYHARVVSKSGDRVDCQLAGRTLVTLPAGSIPENVEGFRLQIDPERVKRLVKGVREEPLSVISGHVVEISQDRGRVTVVLDLDIKLSLSLTMKDYLADAPVIGSRLSVSLPADALHCTVV